MMEMTVLREAKEMTVFEVAMTTMFSSAVTARTQRMASQVTTRCLAARATTVFPAEMAMIL